ncbi:AAA family ATPase [Streptomyces sp. NBC_00624]|uniref:AAA family ATPase n=1 Tax=Streptomyces sp. NBC_00624 TaxID=2975791 RepID=UPI0030E0282E
MSLEFEIRREELRTSGLVGTVAIAEYGEQGGLRDRKHVLHARERFIRLCDQLGFGRAEKLEGDGTLAAVAAGLHRFVAAEADRKILYWTGHGHATDDSYILACRDSYKPGTPHPDPRLAMPFDMLMLALSRVQGSELLVVIDACESQRTLHGSRSLHDALRAARRTGRSADGFVVLATAGADRPMEESLWVDWLQQALDDPNLELDGTVRPFERTAPFLLMPDLLEAIDRRAQAAGFEDAAMRPAFSEIHSLSRRFLHNPHFDAIGPVYRPAVLPPDREPWLTSHRLGPITGGIQPHQFSGRVRPLSRLATWMASQSRGMLVVTGPAGTGKTALLARLALLSVRHLQQALDSVPPPQTVPPPGSVHGAVSCHGASLHSLAQSLLNALAPLGVEVPEEAAITAQAAVDRIGTAVPRIGGITLLVDGLDEAMPGQPHEIARRLLNPLSRCPGVKVIVGTRAHPRRPTDGEARESLLDALDRSSPDLVLDRDRETERDIAALVASLLDDVPGSPYAGPDAEALRREAAAQVARQCGRRFLVARLVAQALARRAEPLSAEQLDSFVRHGGDELRERMTDELNVLDPGDRGRYAELLLPLAVVQGPGLADRELWLRLANKLRRRGTSEIMRAMLDGMLQRLKGVLITTERRPGQEPLHRLDHASYGTALLERARLSEAAAHRRVFDALFRPAGDWDQADEYTLTYLGAHAAQIPASLDDPPDEQHPLEQLFCDPGFLVRTEPDVMLPLTGRLIGTCDGAALYRRVGARFKSYTSQDQRRAMLSAEAFVGHPDTHETLGRLPGFAEHVWREVWTDAVPQPPELTLPAPLGGALALSWSRAAGGTISVAGRGEIVTRRADTGAYLHTRRPDDGRTAGSVFAEVREVTARGRRITASHDGRWLHLWWGDERRPRRSYTWDGRIGALDAARCDDGVQIVAADGKCVWAWRCAVAPRRAEEEQDIRHDVLPVPAERVALLSLRDRCFLLTAGDALTLHELNGKLYGDQDLVRAGWEVPAAPGRRLAVSVLPEDAERGLVAVSEAASDGERVTVWRVTAQGHTPPVVTRLRQYDSVARELALGRRGDLPLLALHEGHRVRVYSPTDDTVDAVLELSNERSGLAFDPAGTGRLAVGDGDEVRVIDTAGPAAAGALPLPRRSEPWPRPAVTTDRSGNVMLLARAAGRQVMVGLHHPVRGRAGDGLVLPCESRVTAVAALGHDDGWTVAAAAGRRVRVWRLDSSLKEQAEDTVVELSGDAGDSIPGLALVPGPSGGPWLFVPEGRRVVPFLRKGTGWARQGAIEAAQIRVCDVAAYTASGRTWVAAHCGDALTLWESTEQGGFTRLGTRRAEPDSRAGITLTCQYEDGELFPLVAWSEAGSGRLAEYDGDSPARHFSSPNGTPTALAFAGTLRRPLLLAFGGEGTVAVRDVVDRRWVTELTVPYRGAAVHTANAVHITRHGLSLFLQGRDRCDQVRIPPDRLGTAVGRA